jgi:hypothetical protein
MLSEFLDLHKPKFKKLIIRGVSGRIYHTSLFDTGRCHTSYMIAQGIQVGSGVNLFLYVEFVRRQISRCDAK